MSSRELKSWSYVVLALVGDGEVGAHDLVDMLRRGGRLFFAAAPSQVYAETKRLSDLGFLQSTRAPGRTRGRTVYQLTDTGRAALVRWLGAPTPFPRIQSEANVRLLAGDLTDDATLLTSLQALRGELDELEALARESEERLAELPHRARYLRLSYSLGRRVLDAHRAWLDEVERELQADRR